MVSCEDKNLSYPKKSCPLKVVNMLNSSKSIYYSVSLKRQVVREYESGHFSKTELCEKYGILGSSTLLEWCKKYSTLATSSILVTKKGAIPMKVKRVKEPSLSPEVEQTKHQRRRRIEQERISELEKALDTARSREQLYLHIIELSSKQVGEDLLKKTGMRSCVLPVPRDG
jgi:transposase-like protein